MIDDVAALFVDARGEYPKRFAHYWDEKKDARLYDLALPVIAHPPCQRWCRLAGMVEARWGHKGRNQLARKRAESWAGGPGAQAATHHKETGRGYSAGVSRGTDRAGSSCGEPLSVVALYTDPRGPYPRLLGLASCFDGSDRRPSMSYFDGPFDATLYRGPGPIVAHPPCGPWGGLRRQYKGSDHALAPLAVVQVQTWGGVLEHPAHSGLWKVAPDLPGPGDPIDVWGGFTLEIDQCDWGHCARKRTWLYVVAETPEQLRAELMREIHDRPSQKPTHYIGGSRNNPRGSIPAGMKAINAEKRIRTPEPFARWLISIAERCRG